MQNFRFSKLKLTELWVKYRLTMEDLITKVSIDLILQFESIARLRSLKLASKELNISPSAITQSLKVLEDRLETTLCIRGRKKFILTDSGQIVFASALKIKNEINQLSNNLNKEPMDYSGLFSIGIIDNFSMTKYKEILVTVVKSFPKMKLAIQSIDSIEMIEWVREGELDVGFGVFHEKDPSLKYIKIGHEKFTYLVGKNHSLFKKRKLEKKDLYGERLTWHGSELRNRAELQHEVFRHASGFKMDLKAYTNNESAALDILDSGFAVVPLTSKHASKGRRDTMIQVKTPELNSYMVYNPKIVLSPILKHVLEFLKV